MPDIAYLSQAQIDDLLQQPDVTTISGLRDMTIIGLLFCTGMNETELCRLTMADIDPVIGISEWSIHVPEGADGQGRWVTVYDNVLFDQPWLARYLQRLLRQTGVQSGPVFRGLRRDGKTVRSDSLTPRAVRQILKTYPIVTAGGFPITFTALDLRRTFARRLYLAGVEFEAIQANLGHGSTTTREYIGPPEKFNAPSVKKPLKATSLLLKLKERRP